MNTWKRWLSLALCLALCMGMLPVTARATDAESELQLQSSNYWYIWDSGQCGSNAYYTVINWDGNLYAFINGTGATWDLSSFSALYNTRDYSAIVVGDGITSIGDGIFKNTYADVMIVGNSVQSIGTDAFSYSCFGDLYLPASLTSVGGRCFFGDVYSSSYYKNLYYAGTSAQFQSIKNISTSGNANLAKYNSIIVNAGPFGTCGDTMYFTHDGTLRITGFGPMQDWDADNGYFPAWCYYQVPSVVFSGCVETIGDFGFLQCGFSSINLPSSLERIGYRAFFYCENLTNISVPDSVTVINDMAFQGCSSLRTATLSKNLDEIPIGLFAGCSSLRTVTIPASVESIQPIAFYGCDSLTDVYYGGTAKQWLSLPIGTGNDSFYNATIHVQNEPVTGVTLDRESLELNIGDTATLAAEVQPSDASDKAVEWSSSDTVVAAVSSNGTITAVGVGTATITVTTEDGGKTASCTVTVYEADQSCTVTFDPNGGSVSPTSITVTCGETYNDLPTPTREGFTFNGWYTAASGGTQVTPSTKVTATSNHTLYAHWTADAVPVTSVVLDKSALTITAGDSEILTATVAPHNAVDQTVTWTTSDTSVATVSNGTVTAVGAGSATITATADGKSGTCSVTVVKPVSSFTVTFAASGGSGTMPAQTVAEGGSLTLPACGFTAPSGKRFKAWSVGGREYAVGAAITVTGNTTVTTVWEEVPAVSGAVIEVGDAVVRCGGTVTVPIIFKNNPGIVSYRLSIAYDPALLSLENAEAGDFSETTFGPLTANPFTISRNGGISANLSGDNTAVLLTFRASDTAGNAAISVSYDADDVFNSDLENVTFAVKSGTVSVIDYISGDVDGNGVVNMKDLALFQRWLNGWDVTIDERAADVNASGKPEMKDLALLQRYLNGWDVELR